MTVRRRRAALAALVITTLGACGDAGLNRSAGGVYAPGPAEGEGADPMENGHRLMEAD